MDFQELEQDVVDEWVPHLPGPLCDHVYQREMEQRQLQASIDEEMWQHGQTKTTLLPDEQFSRFYPPVDNVLLAVMIGRSLYASGLYHPLQELAYYL